MSKGFFIVSLLLMYTISEVYAQDSIMSPAPNSSVFKKSRNAAKKVTTSLENDLPDKELAHSYNELAKQLESDREYKRAEDYYKRALSLYQNDKNSTLVADTYRNLARVQEVQGKREQAILNYENAAKTTKISAFKQLNRNDVKRLKNSSSTDECISYIEQNLIIASGVAELKGEVVLANQQLAAMRRKINDTEGEIEALQMVIEQTEETLPEVAIEAKQNIARIYEEEKHVEKAIELKKEIVEGTKALNDPVLQISQLHDLSETYEGTDASEEAVQYLEEAYEISVKGALTIAARNSVKLLGEQYKQQKNTKKALELYDDFLDRLDELINQDSTLVDERYFQLQEERIISLENERELKDELLAKKNVLNYVLFISTILFFIFMLLIVRALFSIKKKNKRIALQSLRREMNPHFIFNSLNSLNQFIAQNNEREANKYLSSYSKLMRNIMENSNNDFISLSKELDHIKQYLDLEQLRFKEKFEYIINMDKNMDPDALYIPNMLLQPQIENAIWHGLRYREGKGQLVITISLKNEIVCVTIEDNGIGLIKSNEIKTSNQKMHKSRGLTNTRERINLLNDLYNIKITMELKEKEFESGVMAILCFPVISQKIVKNPTDN